GSTTWPHGSPCSASTPKRHPLSTQGRRQASPLPRVSAQIQPPDATNPQVSMMYSPRAHNREPSQVGLALRSRARDRAEWGLSERLGPPGVLGWLARLGTGG